MRALKSDQTAHTGGMATMDWMRTSQEAQDRNENPTVIGEEEINEVLL